MAISDRLRYILEADPTKFRQGTAQAERHLKRFNRSIDGLEGSQKNLTRTSGRSRQSLQSLGFMMNDMQQFSYGASQGVRAISNNLSMLAIGLGAGGATILALEAGATVMALFADELFRGSRGAKEFDKRLKGIKDRVKELRKELPAFGLSGAAKGEAHLEDLQAQLLRAQQKMADVRNPIIRQFFPGMSVKEIEASAGMRGELKARVEAAEPGLSLRITQLEQLIQAQREENSLLRVKEGVEEEIQGTKGDQVNLSKVQLDLSSETLKMEQEIAFTLEEQAKKRQKFREQRRQLLTNGGIGTSRFREGVFSGAGVSVSDLPDDPIDIPEKLETGWTDSLSAMSAGFGQFSSAAFTAFDAIEGRGSTFFGAMKAFSIAEATINTYVAATKALTAGPVAGPILAGGIIASGLAMVATIASMQPGGRASAGGVSSSFSTRRGNSATAGTFIGPAGSVSALPAGSVSGGMMQDRIVGVVKGRDLVLIQQNMAAADRRAGR